MATEFSAEGLFFSLVISPSIGAFLRYGVLAYGEFWESLGFAREQEKKNGCI